MASSFGSILQGLSTLGSSVTTDVALANGPQLIPGTSTVAIPNACGGYTAVGTTLTSLASSSSILILVAIGIALFFLLRKKSG